MQKLDEIRNECELQTVQAAEFVIQTGQRKFYIYTPKQSDLFITCDSPSSNANGVGGKMKEKYTITDYVEITMSELCRGALPNHVFYTGTDITSEFEMNLESISMNLTELFEDNIMNEQSLVELMEEKSSTGGKMNIRDIRKSYDLTKITYHQKKINMWLYCALSIIGLIALVGIGCKFKNKLPGMSREKKGSAVNTYISMSKIDTDAENGHHQCATKSDEKKSEVAKITSSS